MKIKIMPKLAPSHIILLSFIATIGLGTVLLSLPTAQKDSISFLDTLFTAISSTTTTGMFTIDLHTLTPFGQSVVIGLVQIGALGIMMLTLGLMYLFFEFHKSFEILIATTLNLEKIKNLKIITYWVLGLTAIIELTGAFILYPLFKNYYGAAKAWWYALFHSISAFTNAGVTLFEGYSMTMFRNDILVQVSFFMIMFLGTIGFVIIREFVKYIPARLQGEKYAFSTSSKIAWYTTVFLISCATLLFFVLENDNSLAAKNFMHTVSNSIFNAIGSSGAGFSTVYMTALYPGTLVVIMIMAFIGTAPGSTGSGIKTTTFVVILATLRAAILGKKDVILLGEKVPTEEIRKAISIIALSIPWVIFATILLTIIEPEFTFLQVLFESVSAFATLGLSTGITPYLTTMSKIVLMSNMILGRIGPFTLIFALRKAIKTPKKSEDLLLD